MQIISHAADEHTALINLLSEAVTKAEEHLKTCELELKKAQKRVAEFKALPALKRAFAFFEPCTYFQENNVEAAKLCITWLAQLLHLTTLKLTIELNDCETDKLLELLRLVKPKA